MRRAPLLVLVLALAFAMPAAAKPARTPVRVQAPAAANATVAGFELDLVRAKKGSVKASAAAALPKNVSVYAVLARQKRSDRVKGVLVIVNRAPGVRTTPARASKRRLTVNLSHARLPKGFRLKLKVRQAGNVLSRHRAFSCGSYFKPSDLAGAQKLAGPRLPNITTGTVVQAACSAAKSGKPFATLGEFRGALNAPAGRLSFAQSPTPNQVDGTASFNYGVRALSVQADASHQFTACAFPAGTCAVSSTPGHANDYVVLTLSAPAAAGALLPVSLAMTPNPAPALPFQFFGFDQANHRLGPLLTSGP